MFFLQVVESSDVLSFLSLEKISIIGLLVLSLWILFRKMESLENKREEERKQYVQDLKGIQEKYDHKIDLINKDIMTLNQDSREALREVSAAVNGINETLKEVKIVHDKVLNKLNNHE